MISLSKPRISPHFKEWYLSDVIDSGWWTMGKITQQLEEEFAHYKKVKHAIAVSSCSAALHLAVKACKDELGYRQVLTTPMTFCSTTNSIIHSGLYPRFIDIDEKTKCMDFGDIVKQLELSDCYFQGIVLTHFGGHPCNMDHVETLQKNYGVWVVEDCAHAIESEWKGKKVGTFGDVGCFSFSPVKNVSAPEMGMIITNNDEIAEKVKLWRLHGLSASAFDRVERPGQYEMISLGYKYNCTDIEAAFALDSLRMIEENWQKRVDIACFYRLALEDFGCRIVTKRHDDIKHGLHLFQIELKNRDKFILEMFKKGIYCGIHYKPVHRHIYYTDHYSYDPNKIYFPNAESFGDHTVSLPIGPGMTAKDIDYVISTMTEILKNGDFI